MDEYISKQRAKDLMGCCLASAKANYKEETDVFKRAKFQCYVETIEAMIDVVGAVETSDVQPVNQWISVNDKLPENAKPCAVVTEDNGLGVSRYMGRNRFEWTLFGELVLYWMPLPEPPKDGDTSE